MRAIREFALLAVAVYIGGGATRAQTVQPNGYKLENPAPVEKREPTPNPESQAASSPLPRPPAPAPALTPLSLKSIHRIYIEKMDNDLDQYLRAEIVKQFKGKVQVVLAKEDADGILAGVSQEEKGTGAKITGRYLGLHDVASGTISLLDREGKTILWANEAGDRNIWLGALARGGQRKVADRLIGKLKKAMGH